MGFAGHAGEIAAIGLFHDSGVQCEATTPLRQFNPATEYINDKLLDETTDKATKDAYAERGFVHVPATGSHGGVIATGGIRRDATLSLAALRLLSAGTDKEQTLVLRRYILGLSLVALTANASTYLRQGCNLVPDIDKPREFKLVHSDGTKETLKLSHADALTFALAAAKAFGSANQEMSNSTRSPRKILRAKAIRKPRARPPLRKPMHRC